MPHFRLLFFEDAPPQKMNTVAMFVFLACSYNLCIIGLTPKTFFPVLFFSREKWPETHVAACAHTMLEQAQACALQFLCIFLPSAYSFYGLQTDTQSSLIPLSLSLKLLLLFCYCELRNRNLCMAHN